MTLTDATEHLRQAARLSFDAIDPRGRRASLWAEHSGTSYVVRSVRYARRDPSWRADEAVPEAQWLLYAGPSAEKAAEVLLRDWCGELVAIRRRARGGIPGAVSRGNGVHAPTTKVGQNIVEEAIADALAGGSTRKAILKFMASLDNPMPQDEAVKALVAAGLQEATVNQALYDMSSVKVGTLERRPDGLVISAKGREFIANA